MTRAAAVKRIRESIAQQQSRRHAGTTTLPRFDITMGVHGRWRVLMDGKPLEHLVSGIRVSGAPDDLPKVTLDFPAELVEIEGQAVLEAPPCVMFSRRPLSDHDTERIRRAFGGATAAELNRRLRSLGERPFFISMPERPRTFWALHVYEFRRSFL